jgi:hypothetical protein
LFVADQLIAGAFVGLAAIVIPQLVQLGVESVVNRVVVVQGISPGWGDRETLTELEDGVT